MIIAKKSSFGPRKDPELVLKKLSKEQWDNLKWADRTAIMIIDNYILLSGHLSSKAEKNKPQIEQLKRSLLDLRNACPDYEIILGGDINSFLQSEKPFSDKFNCYPDSEKVLTTIKKRTMTQGQFHKGNKVIEESKDKIITTLKIEKANTMYISGRIPKPDNYVPSNEHPFDHFVLVAKLALHPSKIVR
ncbi:unnamed protein product [Sphagnum balticum]